jgi:HisJ family histidinol phosphate phosphatase
MRVLHDIHIHTHISSCCVDNNSNPENIIKTASEKGYKTIGFSDHVWDNPAFTPSEWYRPQNLEHILKIKQELPKDTYGVKVLIGCETEYCGNGIIGLSKEAASQLDYVLVPMSHTHQRGFVIPDKEYTNIEVAKLMINYFKEVVNLDIATGIAHPFAPLGFKDVDGILNCILDNELSECFSMAAEKRVSIEINAAVFHEALGKYDDTYHDESFIRIFKIAKKCGCLFHFGSDAHSLESLKARKESLEKIVEEIGIEEKDITPSCR